METLNQSALASEFDLQVAAHIATKQATYNAEMKLIKPLIRFSFARFSTNILTFCSLLFCLFCIFLTVCAYFCLPSVTSTP